MENRIPADMPPDRWFRLRQLLDRALDEPGQRTALLIEVRAEDPALCDALECLVAEHQSVGEDDSSVALAADLPMTNDLAGQRIGSYEIVREIGRGGMGTVFLAVRADGDVRVPFALKILRHGYITDQPDKAFQRERLMLAQLDHPGIARLVDWGTVAGGLLYLVIEYVDGQPITTFCSSHNLTLDARLDLFLQICASVEHAHQRLIVHRDLKPSNILVPESGRAKLLDFGIAARLDASSMNTTLRLTPAYSSPEQLLGGPVTVAADVYSLGVLLYEMLAGRLPYEADSVKAVLTEQPAAPSVRATEVGVSSKELAGDLDAIVLKALRKEPELRYPSVEQMAADIRRSQTGQPVSAVPDTRRYRLSRYVRRNRAVLALSALAVCLLIAGTEVWLWKWRATETRNEQLRDVTGSVIDSIFGRNWKNTGFGETLIMAEGSQKDEREISQRMGPEIVESVGNREDDLAMETAIVYERLGDYEEMQNGRRAGALVNFQKGHAIFLAQWTSHPDKVRGNWLLNSYSRLGFSISDPRKAVELLKPARPVSEWLLQHYPDDPEAVLVTAHLAAVQGQRLRSAGDLPGALVSYNRATTLLSKTLERMPQNLILLTELEQARFEEVSTLESEGRLETAMALLDRLASFEPACKCKIPTQLAIQSSVRAELLRKMKNYPEANRWAKLSITELEKLLRPYARGPNWNISVAYFVLGDIQFDEGRLDEARQSHTRALELRRELARQDRTNIPYQEGYAASLNRTARILLDQRRELPVADDYANIAMGICGRIMASSPNNIYARVEYARAYRRKAEVALRGGDFKEAKRSLLYSDSNWRYARQQCERDVELAPEAEETARELKKLAQASR